MMPILLELVCNDCCRYIVDRSLKQTATETVMIEMMKTYNTIIRKTVVKIRKKKKSHRRERERHTHTQCRRFWCAQQLAFFMVPAGSVLIITITTFIIVF